MARKSEHLRRLDVTGFEDGNGHGDLLPTCIISFYTGIRSGLLEAKLWSSVRPAHGGQLAEIPEGVEDRTSRPGALTQANKIHGWLSL